MDAPLLKKSAGCCTQAIDRGVTYADSSPDYGSQARSASHGQNPPYEVFLSTKVHKLRRYDLVEGTPRNLKNCDRHVDLIQVHQPSTPWPTGGGPAPDGAPGGAGGGAAGGAVPFIGITGHSLPWFLARALERYALRHRAGWPFHVGPAGRRPRGSSILPAARAIQSAWSPYVYPTAS